MPETLPPDLRWHTPVLAFKSKVPTLSFVKAGIAASTKRTLRANRRHPLAPDRHDARDQIVAMLLGTTLLGTTKQIEMTDMQEIVCARRVTNADHGTASCFQRGFKCGRRYRDDGGCTLGFLRRNPTSLTKRGVLPAPKADEARTTCEPRPTAIDVPTVRMRPDQAAALSNPSWVSAVTPSSRPISSTILPSITLSTVVPVKCILRPVAAGSPPTRKSLNAGPV
jgi:hypothetical protein